jgi:hypothetical protein
VPLPPGGSRSYVPRRALQRASDPGAVGLHPPRRARSVPHVWALEERDCQTRSPTQVAPAPELTPLRLRGPRAPPPARRTRPRTGLSRAPSPPGMRGTPGLLFFSALESGERKPLVSCHPGLALTPLGWGSGQSPEAAATLSHTCRARSAVQPRGGTTAEPRGFSPLLTFTLLIRCFFPSSVLTVTSDQYQCV